jgi:hypothetical protein
MTSEGPPNSTQAPTLATPARLSVRDGERNRFAVARSRPRVPVMPQSVSMGSSIHAQRVRLPVHDRARHG